MQSVEGGLEVRKGSEVPSAPHHRPHLGSNVTFGERKSTIRRIVTGTTELSTQQSADGRGMTEDGDDDASQARMCLTRSPQH